MAHDSSQPDEVWLTPHQVTERFQIHPEMLRKLADRGEIPHVKISERTRRYRESDLRAWIEGRMEGQVSA